MTPGPSGPKPTHPKPTRPVTPPPPPPTRPGKSVPAARSWRQELAYQFQRSTGTALVLAGLYVATGLVR